MIDRTPVIRRRGTRALASTLLVMLCTTTSVAAAPSGIAPAFVPNAMLPGSGANAPFSCPTPVAPLIDMSNITTFYQSNDPTQSHFDPAALAAFRARVALPTQYKVQLRAIESAWSPAAARRRQVVSCLATTVASWAKAGALLQGLEDNDPADHRQAILLMVWTAIPAAFAFSIADAGGGFTPGDRQAVLGWFAAMADQIRAEFTPPLDRPRALAWLDRPTNHRFWADTALALMAGATGNRSDFQRGMTTLGTALAQVNASGGLPLELARGIRGVYYQNFAMQPISLLVALADANRVRLSADQEARLDRVARYSIRIWQDPTLLPPTYDPAQDLSQAPPIWTDILMAHIRRTNPDTAALMLSAMASRRPLRSDFISLNISQSFGIVSPPTVAASGPTRSAVTAGTSFAALLPTVPAARPAPRVKAGAAL